MKWIEMVKSGQLDMSVVIDPVEDSQLEKLPVLSSEAVLLVRRNHPLGKRRSVSFGELQNENMLIHNLYGGNLRFIIWPEDNDLCPARRMDGRKGCGAGALERADRRAFRLGVFCGGVFCRRSLCGTSGQQGNGQDHCEYKF